MQNLFIKIIEPNNTIPLNQQQFTNKDLLRLVVPIIMEQFLVLLVGLADTMMISYAGETAVSGVSLINQFNTIFIMIFTALASGGAVIVSQYIGKSDKANSSLSASQLVTVSVLISTVLTFVTLLFGDIFIKTLFGSVEQGVYIDAMTYLGISAYSFPFLAIYNACASLFRSMGNTKTLLYVSLAMNFINVIGNAVGIFVLKAGVAGVAYPSLISRAFAAIFMLALLFRKNSKAKVVLYLTFKNIFTWNFEMIKRIFSVAIPNSIENALFQVSKVALTSIVALFGTTQIAANGIAQSFWSVAALFSIAMGPAFITVIGQYMGRGDHEGAQYYMKKLLRLTYVGSVIWNLLFFAMTPLLLQMYSLSSETVELIIILVAIHNLFNALFCPISFPFSNGLRAAGDVKFPMYASIFSTVVCRVTLSVLFGIILNMGVIGIALAMACDWGIKAIIITYRYRSEKWKKFSLV